MIAKSLENDKERQQSKKNEREESRKQSPPVPEGNPPHKKRTPKGKVVLQRGGVIVGDHIVDVWMDAHVRVRLKVPDRKKRSGTDNKSDNDGKSRREDNERLFCDAIPYPYKPRRS